MTAERLEKPCEDPHEESFRQAYNRMLASHTHIHAQLKATEKRLQITEEAAVRNIGKLDGYARELANYLSQLLAMLPKNVLEGSIDKLGKPPLELKLK